VEEPITSSDQSNALVDELSRGAENDLYADPEIPYAPPSKNEPLPPKKSCGDMPCDWEVGITSVSHMGTGCPEGSVNVVLSEDKKALTLVFSEFVEEAGPDLDASLASAYSPSNASLANLVQSIIMSFADGSACSLIAEVDFINM
jgi:hypothetical protein